MKYLQSVKDLAMKCFTNLWQRNALYLNKYFIKVKINNLNKNNMLNKPSIDRGHGIKSKIPAKVYKGKCRCQKGLVYEINHKLSCSGCSSPSVKLINN